MHACRVVGKLIGGDAVLLHICGIRVTAGTGLGNINGIDSRAWIVGRANVVHTVAVDANGNLAIAGRESFAVDACVVLIELIGPQARIIGTHQCGIRVA